MTDPLRTLQDWIDIDSVTGGEANYGDALARALEAEGLAVEKQQVEPDRFNLLARGASPEVVFCTHLDTVPPFFGPSADRDEVRGRGACDAKGPALAMVEAARSLMAEGERRVGFLLTVGEEVDQLGARRANEELAEPWRPRHVIVGEPTGNRFVRAHKGMYYAHLRAHGVAGHSSREDGGPSAVHTLVESLGAVLGADWSSHELLGRGSVNVGRVTGGVATNVFAPEASAELLFRTVEPPEEVEARLRALLPEGVELAVGMGTRPVEFALPPGVDEGDAPVVAFGTDAPFLDRWGTPLLYGPGEISDAHTDHERLSRASFERAVADYARAAASLLESPA